MLLYRVENLTSGEGLWYNSTDQTSSLVVSSLDLSAKELPMEWDSDIALNEWKSAAESVDQLKFWFTRDDLIKLIPKGFHLYEIEATIVKPHSTEWYAHPLFQEKGVQLRKLLNINILMS